MERRDFLRRLGLGLAGAWAVGRVSWPLPAFASATPGPALRLALLADAHLKDGDEGRPEARALARAVAELRRLAPAPDLVLFAGDLAHGGDPGALALGQEILADLPAPLLMLMGEGDGLPDGAAAWRRFFGDPWFSHLLRETENGKRKMSLQILGLHTAWCPGPGGPSFRVGESGRRWLARELDCLDPEVPLLILSHAPLDPVYRPWSQWTVDGPAALAQLSRFRYVLCVHGHTHNAVASGQWSVVKGKELGEVYFTENRKLKTENCPFAENGKRKTENRLCSLSLPATAWPGPQALQGTPARLGPGLGPAGCGWGLLSGRGASMTCESHLWQA